jgi:hypothetical protein
MTDDSKMFSSIDDEAIGLLILKIIDGLVMA